MSEQSVAYLQSILACKSCNDFANRPPIVYSNKSERPSDSDACRCEQNALIAASHLYTIAANCRNSVRSTLDPGIRRAATWPSQASEPGATTSDQTQASVALTQLHHALADFALRRIGVKHPHRFEHQMQTVRSRHQEDAPFAQTLPDVVEQLSDSIAVNDSDDPSDPPKPLTQAQLQSISGYISANQASTSFKSLWTALAGRASVEGIHQQSLEQALLSAPMDPFDLWPNESAMMGPDEKAANDIFSGKRTLFV
jgi:hypothetical protein